MRLLATTPFRTGRQGLRTPATEVGDGIGSLQCRAVNVAQLEGAHMMEALASPRCVGLTRATLGRHGRPWCNDELFVIARRA